MYLRIGYLALIAGAIAGALSFHDVRFLTFGVAVLILAAVGELIGYWQTSEP